MDRLMAAENGATEVEAMSNVVQTSVQQSATVVHSKQDRFPRCARADKLCHRSQLRLVIGTTFSDLRDEGTC